MLETLDAKDKKLLYALDCNSRAPSTRIAKEIGLSPEVVNYRLKRFEREGIITSYSAIVNLTALGKLQFKLCFSFQHITPAELEQRISTLKRNPEVKWIVSCKGNWDLIVSFETDSLERIGELKNEAISLFGSYVDKTALSILIDAQAYTRDYLVDSKGSLDRVRFITKKVPVKALDDLDLKILKQLSENARKPIVAIAQELKESVRAVNYRIKQLEKSKILLGYKIAINYEKLGLHFFKTFFHLDNPTKQRVSALTSYISSHKNIIHNVRVLGSWDFEPEFEVTSNAEFDEILSDIRTKFSDIVKRIDIISISKEYKFVYF